MFMNEASEIEKAFVHLLIVCRLGIADRLLVFC
jgi:hypothetical protein